MGRARLPSEENEPSQQPSAPPAEQPQSSAPYPESNDMPSNESNENPDKKIGGGSAQEAPNLSSGEQQVKLFYQLWVYALYFDWGSRYINFCHKLASRPFLLSKQPAVNPNANQTSVRSAVWAQNTAS